MAAGVILDIVFRSYFCFEWTYLRQIWRTDWYWSYSRDQSVSPRSQSG